MCLEQFRKNNNCHDNCIQDIQYYILNEGIYQTGIAARDSWLVIDALDLYDDESSRLEDYDKEVDLVWNLMQKHGRVVICCVAGVSHSNAIALGVLVKYFGMDFYDAWKLIRKRVPRANINPSHISKLKKLFNVTLAYQNTNFLFFLLCFENKH